MKSISTNEKSFKGTVTEARDSSFIHLKSVLQNDWMFVGGGCIRNDRILLGRKGRKKWRFTQVCMKTKFPTRESPLLPSLLFKK